MKDQIRISACVITKDEEKNIQRWLDCMKKLADEFIVVDTGSTDRTVEIVRENGIEPYHFFWTDDFAEAKNYAIERATGDWIVFLDADEYFAVPDLPKVRKAMETCEKQMPNVAAIQTPLLNIDADHAGQILSQAVMIRIFRRHPQIRYEGQIHEMLEFSKMGGTLANLNEVVIYHTGYSASIIRTKLERNLAMLRQHEAEHGEEPDNDIFFADCYWGLGDKEMALRYALKATFNPNRRKRLGGEESRLLIAALNQLHHPVYEIEAAVQDAVDTYPEIAEFHLLQGTMYFHLYRYPEAEKSFERGFFVYENRGKLKVNEQGLTDQTHIVWPEACYSAAKLRMLKFDIRGADSYLRKGLRENPTWRGLLRLWWQIHRRDPASRILKQLKEWYPPETHADYLLGMIGNLPAEVCAAYAPFLQDRTTLEKKAFLDRKEAVSILREEVQETSALAVWSMMEMGELQAQMAEVLLSEEWQEVYREMKANGEIPEGHEGDLLKKLMKTLN